MAQLVEILPHGSQKSIMTADDSGLFTKEVNLRLAKCLLVFNGRLASLVKEATGHQQPW